MPRNRDMHLYHNLQAKIRQQEVDYENMHTHSVIVRGPRGKEFVLDGDNQYHEALKRGDFNEKDTVRSGIVTDFNPKNENAPMSKAMDPSRASFNDAIIPAQNRGATKKRKHNLGSPSEVQQRQTLFRNEMEKAHAEQKADAPNMNVDPHLTQFTKTIGERVKERRRKSQYKGLDVTPKKSSTGIGKAKRGTSKTKVRKQDSSGVGKAKTSKKEQKQVRLGTKQDIAEGRASKRTGLTRTGIAGRYMDAKDRGHF